MNTVKIKVADATKLQIDWLAAKCEGIADNRINIKTKEVFVMIYPRCRPYCPSINWHQGGPIIEREKIETTISHKGNWVAYVYSKDLATRIDHKPITQIGPTPLIAAMRCFIASKLGDEVEIPEDLK